MLKKICSPRCNVCQLHHLSDHMSTFVCISAKKSRVKSTKQFLIRNMKKFKLEDYLMTLGNNLNAANL